MDSMPNMVNSHCFHSLVAVKDKLFVISDKKFSCEVFDEVCKKFVTLKPTLHTISVCL